MSYKEMLGIFAAVVVTLVFIIVTISTSPSYEEHVRDVYKEPAVTAWSPNETFTVIEMAKQVGDFNFGKVVVKRQNDGMLFSGFVIPMRNIPIGSTVTFSEVIFYRSATRLDEFLVVQN